MEVHVYITRTAQLSCILFPDDESAKMEETFVKLVVLGDIGVGKTALVRRYTEDRYSPDYRISVDLDHREAFLLSGWLELKCITD